MTRPESLLKKVDKEKIQLAIKFHTPIEITSYTLPRDMELYIYEVLSEFLRQCHQEHMTEYLKFCLGELLTNSKKANTKRVYFKEKHLDIENELQYNEGMLSYKMDTLSNINHYLEEQKKAGLYINFMIQLKDETIVIEIKNNSILTRSEKKRIQEKIKTAQKYNNAQEVMSRVLDQTEGAGLGIIIIILMLEKIGLSKENYKVFCTEKDTVTRMELPLNPQITSDINLLTNTFLETQTLIPVLQEKILQLEVLMNQGTDSCYSRAKEIISSDVMLVTLLLKEAALYNQNCLEITKAFDLLGKDKISEIFSRKNQNIRLIEKLPVNEENYNTWQHSYDTAFYAYNFARNFPVEGVSAQAMYTFGLLHNLEKILLDVISPEQKDLMNQTIVKNEIPDSTVRLFNKNVCNTKGGCIIARKWSLPEVISNVILFHSNPDAAPEDIKPIVNIVYLSDVIQYYLQGKVEYYQINQNVLKSMGIDSENKLNFIIREIQKVK